ncbi:hypothetical protein AVEN_77195-1 [Araneus ventricosus]|uniref:Uncharacterized protein n=1 Tax=Araneus ventricosus TaxID=182803 RepID=A0A4Y2I2P1_ARAVE|nr:hypothetical protein AVEN_77195-1 [Araneus ventricosus]
MASHGVQGQRFSWSGMTTSRYANPTIPHQKLSLNFRTGFAWSDRSNIHFHPIINDLAYLTTPCQLSVNVRIGLAYSDRSNIQLTIHATQIQPLYAKN